LEDEEADDEEWWGTMRNEEWGMRRDDSLRGGGVRPDPRDDDWRVRELRISWILSSLGDKEKLLKNCILHNTLRCCCNRGSVAGFQAVEPWYHVTWARIGMGMVKCSTGTPNQWFLRSEPEASRSNRQVKHVPSRLFSALTAGAEI